MSDRGVCREASHAGSWYSASGSQLNAQLEAWLSQAPSAIRPARAIIAPHAGYTYCGACAAHAYKQVDPMVIRRVFILGPSHHVPLSRCALSPAEIYRTPLYDLRIDQKVYADLWKTGMFERMSLQTDEEEHSIEMHLPYTAKAMESCKDEFAIVPVLVGALSESKEQEYGKLLSKYLMDPCNLFVISSDFCHWGERLYRFRYTYYDETQGEIYRSIEHLDKMGMAIIEQLDPISFSNYLKKYHNTICGRHPIGVLLNAVSELRRNGADMSFSFLNYAQSSQCRNWQDSSVSYAAGALPWFHPDLRCTPLLTPTPEKQKPLFSKRHGARNRHRSIFIVYNIENVSR
ncbi:protein MEMO1-like isoform X1 [Arapaima gigas]